MTTSADLALPQMGTHIDVETRHRIAANLRFLRHLHEFQSVSGMARRMKMSRSALNRYLKGERTVGLDVLLLAKAAFGASLDWFVTNKPPAKFFQPQGDE